jgi:competence protein ComEC
VNAPGAGWRAQVAARPRHVALAAIVCGLLAGTAAAAVGAAAAAVALPVGLAVALALRAARLSAPGGAALAAVLLVGGAVLAERRIATMQRSALPAAFGTDVREPATLLSAPRADAFGGRRAQASLRGEPVVLRWAPWMTARGQAAAGERVGRELLVAGRLDPPDLGARAVGAHATVRLTAAQPTGRRRGGLLGAVDGVRDRAQDVLRRGPPPADAALLEGMVLGQDAALPTAVREDLRAAGLAHLVAASGANVMLLAGLAGIVLAAAGMPIRPRRVALVGLIGLYVLVAGAGPSIVRAGIMGGAGILALAASRPASRWYGLGLAAAVTLALDPWAVADPGWEMSFAAVLALVLIAPRLQRWAAARGLPRGVAEAIAVAGCATLATAPIAAAHFGRTSIVAVPANLAAAPAVAPATWLGMAGAAAGQIAPAAARPLVELAATPTAYVRWVGQTAAGVPGADRELPWPLVLAVSAAGLAAAARLRTADGRRLPREAWSRRRVEAIRSRRILTAAALVAVTLALLPAVARRTPAGVPARTLRLAFLDVGQGDATLVEAGGRRLLVDTGPPEGRVVDRLAALGVGRVDAVVLSHRARDHDGGLAALRRRLGPPELRPRAGRILTLGPLRARVLWPPAGVPDTGEENDRAVVLEVEAFGRRALLPADAESPVLGRAGVGSVDVLKVSHHGSADAGLPAVLRATTPAVAVISAGAHNPYGHPAPATMEALVQAGVPVRRTDREGTVVIDLPARTGAAAVPRDPQARAAPAAARR